LQVLHVPRELRILHFQIIPNALTLRKEVLVPSRKQHTMEERTWTKAQSDAMSATERTLLISAAAGSGKTATLTERIIRRLTDSENPADLSRMLIVTFTRAAAAELRQRISEALAKALAKNPDNSHLQRQYIGLGGAHISTIDAFCLEPVKTHFAEIGLPASFRIADNAELLPLSERVMEELIEEFYIKYAQETTDAGTFSLLHGNPFAALCDSMTPSKNDRDLIPTLQELYNRLLNFPDELDRLKKESEHLLDQANGDFLMSDHGKLLFGWVEAFCASALPFYNEACDLIEADEAASKSYLEAFEYDRSLVQKLSEQNTYEDMRNALTDYAPKKLKSLTNAAPEFVSAKQWRSIYKDEMIKLRDTYFAWPIEEIRHDMRFTAEMCAVLYDFLTTYDKRIAEEKRARGICDFTDNRRLLLKMLRDENGEPSPLAIAFRNQYDEVYIDEYQDVDEMQDEIFRLIGGNHRFIVGDIKQSIYGFRGADPTVFARYRENLPILTDISDPVPACGGNSIFMSDNFRCDESVIRVTNAVCGHIFRACPETIGYKTEDDLGFSKKPPHDGYIPSPVQVHLLYKQKGKDTEEEPSDDTVLGGADAEAAHVANVIADLLRSKATLASGKIIKPSDIVILMRSRTSLNTYIDALTHMGVPTGCEELETQQAGHDLLHGADMMYLVNLLRVMDNPECDIPLSEVLRAPFPNFTLQDVLDVRAVGEEFSDRVSLYRGLEEYRACEDHENTAPDLYRKVCDFLSFIEHYRGLCATQSADALLRLLRKDQRCAARGSKAFVYLYDSARGYKASQFLSLYAFLRYFEKKLLTTKYIDVPEDKSEGGHVSIMTMHQSKGLEFPVCFIVRCGQTFSAKSYSKDILFEKQSGLAMKLYERGVQVTEDGETVLHNRKYDTLLRNVTAHTIRTQEREDEMRLLYVAMTRARERLYIVGQGSANEPPMFAPGDRFATLSCTNYMKWVRVGLAMHPECAPFYTFDAINQADVVPGKPLTRGKEEAADSSANTGAERYRDIIDSVPTETPVDIAVRNVPTKISASRMVDMLLDNCVCFDTNGLVDDGKPSSDAEGVFCDPQTEASIREQVRLMSVSKHDEFELLLRANSRPTATERGTAAHLFLQYCDYENVREHGIDHEIVRLLEQKFINERTASILSQAKEQLQAFFDSDFFARIHKESRPRREVQFSRFVPLATLTSNRELAEALGDRQLLVQGSIDLICEFKDGHIEICDYKTDHITKEERADLAVLRAHMQEKHGAQLRQYAAAVQSLYKTLPSRAYIYSLPLGEAIEIDIS